MTLRHENLTGQIIKAFYKVYNELGYGFLEKVYEKALALELMSTGLQIGRQQAIRVYYRTQQVGDYYADLIVENLVIIELKCAEGVSPAHEAQLLNYLKATEIEIGLLLNFGPKPEFAVRSSQTIRSAIEIQHRSTRNPCESVRSASSVVYLFPLDGPRMTRI